MEKPKYSARKLVKVSVWGTTLMILGVFILMSAAGMALQMEK